MLGKVGDIHYQAHFLDVVDERVVFAYVVALDGRPRTVSLVTVELTADGDHTEVSHTEQYTLIDVVGDGQQDAAHQEGGLRLLLNGLQAAVEGRRT